MGFSNLNIALTLANFNTDESENVCKIDKFLSTVKAVSDMQGENRCIPKISVVLWVAAKGKVSGTDNPTTFDMTKTYDVVVRLTEVNAGVFYDLGSFMLNVKDMAIPIDDVLVCNTTRTGVFDYIPLPMAQQDEKFVLKVCVREHHADDLKQEGWRVQTILPLNLEFLFCERG